MCFRTSRVEQGSYGTQHLGKDSQFYAQSNRKRKWSSIQLNFSVGYGQYNIMITYGNVIYVYIILLYVIIRYYIITLATNSPTLRTKSWWIDELGKLWSNHHGNRPTPAKLITLWIKKWKPRPVMEHRNRQDEENRDDDVENGDQDLLYSSNNISLNYRLGVERIIISQ